MPVWLKRCLCCAAYEDPSTPTKTMKRTALGWRGPSKAESYCLRDLYPQTLWRTLQLAFWLCLLPVSEDITTTTNNGCNVRLVLFRLTFRPRIQRDKHAHKETECIGYTHSRLCVPWKYLSVRHFSYIAMSKYFRLLVLE